MRFHNEMMKRAHILVHCNYNPITSRGGIELFVSHLLDVLADDGYESSCFSGDFVSAQFDKSGIRYVCRKILFKASGSPFLKLGNWFFLKNAFRSKIIIYQEPYPSLWPAILLLSILRRHRIIVVFHADPDAAGFTRRIYANLRAMVFSRSVCVTTSESVSRQIASTSGLHSRVIPLCVRDRIHDPSTIPAFPEAPQVYALYIGRLASYKGIEVLLEAAAMTPEVTYLIAGDGPLSGLITETIGRESMANIYFLNRSVSEEEKDYLIDHAEFVVFPSTSRNEAFGLVQLEAMRAGKAIINTELGTGVNDVAPHMVCSITVPPRNAQELGAAARKLWTDRSLSRKLGESGLCRYRSEFSVKRFTENWSDLIKEVEVCQ